MQVNDERKVRLWQEHISNWKQSSLGIREYCQKQGISKDTFYYWQKKLSPESNSKKIIAKLSSRPSPFVPVIIAPTQAEATKALSYLQDPRWLGEFASALIKGLR